MEIILKIYNRAIVILINGDGTYGFMYNAIKKESIQCCNLCVFTPKRFSKVASTPTQDSKILKSIGFPNKSFNFKVSSKMVFNFVKTSRAVR